MQGPEHLPAYKPGGRLETFDIEELVAEGKAGYAAHLIVSRAALPILALHPPLFLLSTAHMAITAT